MADLLILAVETATGCGSVSLTAGGRKDGRLLAEYTLQPDTAHSRRLLGSVAQIVEATGTAWADLAAVAVSLGPGSFTGLRIGMAAAKGMAMAAGLPLVGVPTLDGLAVQVEGDAPQLCCLLDARKQQVYAAFYRQHAGFGWQRSSGFLVLSPAALLERITEPTLLVGPGARVYGERFAASPLVRLPVSACLAPRAAAIGLCGADLLQQGHGGPAAALTPLYVRASEAELNILPQEGIAGMAS